MLDNYFGHRGGLLLTLNFYPEFKDLLVPSRCYFAKIHKHEPAPDALAGTDRRNEPKAISTGVYREFGTIEFRSTAAHVHVREHRQEQESVPDRPAPPSPDRRLRVHLHNPLSAAHL